MAEKKKRTTPRPPPKGVLSRGFTPTLPQDFLLTHQHPQKVADKARPVRGRGRQGDIWLSEIEQPGGVTRTSTPEPRKPKAERKGRGVLGDVTHAAAVVGHALDRAATEKVSAGDVAHALGTAGSRVGREIAGRPNTYVGDAARFIDQRAQALGESAVAAGDVVGRLAFDAPQMPPLSIHAKPGEARINAAVKKTEKAFGRKLTDQENQQMASLFGPAKAPIPSRQAGINFAAGVGGALLGLGSPAKVAKEAVRLGYDVGVGTSLAVMAASDPSLSYKERKRRGAQMPAAIKGAYDEAFGKALTWRQAGRKGYEHPINTLAMVPAPVGLVAQPARIAWLAARGAKAMGGAENVAAMGGRFAGARQVARDPLKPRTLTYQEPGAKLATGGRGPKGAPVEIETPWPTSVTSRVFVSRPYDALSWGLGKTPILRALPISEQKRAIRAKRKNLRREAHRLSTEGYAAYREAMAFLHEGAAGKIPGIRGQGKNAHLATTLAILAQKPGDLTDAEMEEAVIRNIEQMLADPERMILPGDKPSERELALERRVAVYRRKEDRRKRQKRGRAVRHVAADQDRLASALEALNVERAAAYDDYLRAVPDLGERRTETSSSLRAEADAKFAEATRIKNELEAGPSRSADAEFRAIARLQREGRALRQQADDLARLEAKRVARESLRKSRPPARRPGETLEEWNLRINEAPGVGARGHDQALIENLAAQQALARGPKGPGYAAEARRLIAERDALLQSNQELAAAEAKLRALDTQADVVREHLKDISVDRPPIQSAKRNQFERLLEDIPWFRDNPQAVDDALLAGDAAAHGWAASPNSPSDNPADWWELRDFREAEGEDIPWDAFAQTRAPTSPFKPTPQAERLARNRAVHVRAHRRGDSTWMEKQADGSLKEKKVSPKTMGREFKNDPTYDENGRLLFGGETSYEDVIGRLEEGFRDSFPDASDAEIADKMLKASAFYKEFVFPYLGRVLSTREVQAWLASQVGASPARGVMDLMKVLEKALYKERLPSDKIGLAAQTMARIIYGERDLPKGFKAKISDFTDLGHGTTNTRTYTGHDPDAGAPYVVDRWEARANGVVDPDFIETLYKRFDDTLQGQGYMAYADWEKLRQQASETATTWAEKTNKRRKATGQRPVSLAQRDRKRDETLRGLEAVESKKTGKKVIKADVIGQPGDVLYEHVGSWGEGLAQHLNDIEYLGKKDWDVSDAQALDWAGIQRYVGVHPENVDYALFNQARPVTFEIGAAGRLAEKYPEIGDLPRPERTALTKYMADEVIDVAAKRSGVIPIRSTLGYGGYLTFVSPSIRTEVLAGDRMFSNFIDNIRDLTDEDEVWGSTFTGAGRAFHQLEIRNPAWRDDPNAMLDFWNQFHQEHPEFVGFAPLHEGGFASILTTEEMGAAGIAASKQAALAATIERLAPSDTPRVKFSTLRLQRSTRERSAHASHLGAEPGGAGVGELPAGSAVRGGGADAAAVAESIRESRRFRTTRADRDRIESRLR
jgi:hypothetical protein